MNKIDLNNELIAEFMEFKFNATDSFGNNNYKLPDVYRTFLNCSHFDNLHFDKSWDWLIPVVEKIETLQLPQSIVSYTNSIEVMIYSNECSIEYSGYQAGTIVSTHEDTKIKAVYKAIVEFINYYNKLK